MNTLKYIFLFVIAGLSLVATAQNYSVKGVVIDSKGNTVSEKEYKKAQKDKKK
jgi:hypothetical protein